MGRESGDEHGAPSCSGLMAGFVLLTRLLVIAGVFWGLFQADMPLALFIRSVSRRWIDALGDVGDLLGAGVVLATGGGLLLLAGVTLARQSWRLAGWHALLGQGAAALASNGLKHLVGRPRPRMAHAGSFQLGPSFQIGLDSFPSGHATAAFAMAAVLARYFPRGRWIFYGLAIFITASRVWRNSHFLTDAAAGACLGFLIGAMMGRPRLEWWSTVQGAVHALAVGLLVALAFLWTAFHAPGYVLESRLLPALGIGLLGVGIGSRFFHSRLAGHPKWTRLYPMLTTGMTGLGLACLTGIPLVAVLAAVMLGAAVLDGHARPAGPTGSATGRWLRGIQAAHPAIGACLWTLAVIGCALAVHGLKGVLPIL